MKLKNYFIEIPNLLQTIKLTFNKKDKVLDKKYTQGATIRTGLNGNVIDEDILKDLEDREIIALGAVDNDIHIYLGNEDV